MPTTTFGVCGPGLTGVVYEAGVAAVGRDEILAARAQGAAESLDLVATAAEANVFTELWFDFTLGEYSGTRGFTPEVLALAMERLDDHGWVSGGVPTESGRKARTEIESITDRSQQELIDALGDDLDDIVAASAEISRRLIRGGSLSGRSAQAGVRVTARFRRIGGDTDGRERSVGRNRRW